MGLIDRIKRAFGAAGETHTLKSGSKIGEAMALGPWSGLHEWFLARQVNPHLYEALREAIAPIDGGINRLVTMDGIVRVRGDDETLVAEIEDFIEHVPVNDMECGLQTFVDGMGNERYEQGYAVGEFVPDRRGRDIVGLRVADSKGVHFRRETDGRMRVLYRPPARAEVTRRDGTHHVEALLRNSFANESTTDVLLGAGFAELDSAWLVYEGLNNEAGNPYGVSMMRSIEFVSQILLAIQNATDQLWKRFGDPPLMLTYKTKNRAVKPGTGGELERRRTQLATDLANAMSAKRKGNSVDFVQAIGADDDITVGIIGAQDKIIEIELPARHMLEQIVSKFGLPSWMLGFHWSTAERLAEQQSQIVLQESRTRFVRRRPGLSRLIATMLRLRGRTWERGAWELYQELPNLHDELKRAQAQFLLAQTEMMLRGGFDPFADEPLPGTDQGAAKMRKDVVAVALKLCGIDPATRGLAMPEAAAAAAIEAAIATRDDPVTLVNLLVGAAA